MHHQAEGWRGMQDFAIALRLLGESALAQHFNDEADGLKAALGLCAYLWYRFFVHAPYRRHCDRQRQSAVRLTARYFGALPVHRLDGACVLSPRQCLADSVNQSTGLQPVRVCQWRPALRCWTYACRSVVS